MSNIFKEMSIIKIMATFSNKMKMKFCTKVAFYFFRLKFLKMVDEEPILRKILEDAENSTEESYPIVIDDVYLLFIGIGWVLICFALFYFGKKLCKVKDSALEEK